MTGSAVIFDLDGTLLDTLVDLAETTNSVLAQHGCATHPIEEYRFLVGDGVQVLFERALPPDHQQREANGRSLLESCVETFHQEYSTRWDRQSGLYPGIADLLNTLTIGKVPIGVLSNKPHSFTLKCVDKLLGDWSFAAVFGQREGIPRKPDPAGVHEILNLWSVPAEKCLYIGDTNTDMQTGRAAGCITIGVTWGFRPKEELISAGANHIIDHPNQLLAYLSMP